MIRPVLALERLSRDEKEGKVRHRHWKEVEEMEQMDYLEFIAKVTSAIPDKVQLMVRSRGFPSCRQAYMPMLIGGKACQSEQAAGQLIISDVKMF